MKTPREMDLLYTRYNKRNLVSPDPLQFLYTYTDIKDREIAALIAACFAYGNVKQIIKNVGFILGEMGASPYTFVTTKKWTKDFKYRFTTKEELVNFLAAIKQIIKKYGSLEKCFLKYYKNEDVAQALAGFARELRAHGSVKSLVPDPDKKSALKRLNLFLRWLVRCDEVDPGGWQNISAAGLIVPLDVHMHRIGRMLGLTSRRQADMKTALEISASLKKYCKNDPIKYDFCLTRFGIRDDMDVKDLK